MVTLEGHPVAGHRLAVHLRGHLLLFDRKPSPAYDAARGSRILIAAVFIEAVRLAAVRWLLPAAPLALVVALLLGFAFLSIRLVAGLKPSQIGFRAWRDWTVTERSYFLQVLVIANVVFPAVFAAPLRARLAQPAAVWSLFVPYLLFGFYQEVVYRGLVQTELVRRWGAFAGILVANALYTFGPLHAYYFSSRASLAVPMLAAIFAIGLFFGGLFRQSGNLWIVAVFHAVGNSYIVASLGTGR